MHTKSEKYQEFAQAAKAITFECEWREWNEKDIFEMVRLEANYRFKPSYKDKNAPDNARDITRG